MMLARMSGPRDLIATSSIATWTCAMPLAALPLDRRLGKLLNHLARHFRLGTQRALFFR